ncbi:MAG: phenylacetate--CoA ligase family protein, partial [Lachnospiraceae bacterium]
PISELPIVNKDSFRADYAAFTSDTYRDGKGCRKMSTSGSTGTPLTILQDPDKILRNRADGMFMGAMAGYYVGMKMGFIRVWVHNVKENPLRLFAENMIMVDSSDLSDEAIVKLLADFKKKKVKCLLGYASALAEISLCMDRHNIDGRDFAVRSIIPISESMPQPVRQHLAEQFGCPVQAWYSNEENGIMGVQPAGSECYYIDSSSFHYEILKLDSDEPAKDGELGRIVITDLHNYAFPIIRYDNGDLAVARHQKKGGRTRLYLTELYGRRSDTIYSADGRPLTPYVITNNLWDVDGVRQYRFIQEDVRDYVLEINGDPANVDEAEILRRITPYFGEGANICLKYVDEIPVLNSGKRKYIENRCPLYLGT